MPTQEERKAATRAAIIEAARSSFGSRGFHGTKIEDVAVAAGVAKGAVYHHFKNKEELFEAVLEIVTVDLRKAIEKKLQTSEISVTALVMAVELFFRACSDPETRQIFLIDAPVVLGYGTWQRLDTEAFGQMVFSSLEAAMDQGVIRRQPLEALTHIILGGLQAAAVNCAGQDDFESATRDYLKVFEKLLQGLS
ncbi:MAG: TetR/AcrR family transcriptional regulator [Sneathiellales bacterium]|nr:TetR/AcrR family transcriptional regulator [Sneathiellales bacterium]